MAAVLCGGVFGAPLLLLPHESSHATRVTAAPARQAAPAVLGRTLLSVALRSQLVRYQSKQTAEAATAAPAASAAPATAPTAAPATTSATTSSEPPPLAAAHSVSAPVTTTATPSAAPAPTPTAAPAPTPTAAPAPAPAALSTDSEHGLATWYAAAPAGRCASPTLPFGTVLTVTDDATGATTTSTPCALNAATKESGYPRVVDLSPSGFTQLAYLGQGVVDVTISW